MGFRGLEGAGNSSVVMGFSDGIERFPTVKPGS